MAKDYNYFGKNTIVKPYLADACHSEDIAWVIECQCHVEYWQKIVNRYLFKDCPPIYQEILTLLVKLLDESKDWYRSQHGKEPNFDDKGLVAAINDQIERERNLAAAPNKDLTNLKQKDVGNTKGQVDNNRGKNESG